MTEMDELNVQIQALMKKYKLTMWGMVALIAIYLLCLFYLNNYILVLICCVPMIALAVFNSRYAKQIRALAQKRTELQEAQKKEEARARKEAAKAQKLEQQDLEGAQDLEDAEALEGEEVLADLSSLNELPKAYTVLDDVCFEGHKAAHVVVSPYGIAIVGTKDMESAVSDLLVELNVQAPVIVVDPELEVSKQAAEIEKAQESVLSEPQIMKILYRLSGF